MTPEQIITLFIRAAQVDRMLPDTSRPQKVKSLNLGYVAEEPDTEAQARPTASRNDVGLWNAAMETIALCDNVGQRRALWAWANSKAGGISLSRWAKKVEHILPATAKWRADQAVKVIHHRFCRKQDLHSVSVMNEAFSKEPEIEHKTRSIGVWRDEDAKPLRCAFDTDLAGLEWAEIQNAKRRERKARSKAA